MTTFWRYLLLTLYSIYVLWFMYLFTIKDITEKWPRFRMV